MPARSRAGLRAPSAASRQRKRSRAKKYARNALQAALAILNTLLAAGMMASALSAWAEPQRHPGLSYWGLFFPLFLAANIAFLVFWLFANWRFASLSLVALLLCAGSVRTYWPVNLPSDPPDGAILLLSYNILGLGGKDTVPYAERPIVKYIVQSGADIVCCQEASNLGLATVRQVTDPVYPYQYYGAINKGQFALLSKFPILSTDTVEYESAGNSSLAHVLLVGGDSVLVINNHFESYKLKDGDREEYKDLVREPRKGRILESLRDLTGKVVPANAIRGPQADSVAAYVERSPYKYIIACGDFNDASISYSHHRLTRRLNDAYTRSGNGPGISYNRSGMYFRIDNILCSPNITPYGARVDNSIRASDHYPISCWLELGR